jgi:hypothetical protein
MDVIPPEPPTDLPGIFPVKIVDCNLSDGRIAIGLYDGINGIVRRTSATASQESGIDVRVSSLELEQLSIISPMNCIRLDNAFLLTGNNCNLASLRGAGVELNDRAYAKIYGGSITGSIGFSFRDSYKPTGFNRMQLAALNIRKAVVKSETPNDVAVSLTGCTLSGYQFIGQNTNETSKLYLNINKENSVFANLNKDGNVIF